jgi:hypothetical protein
VCWASAHNRSIGQAPAAKLLTDSAQQVSHEFSLKEKIPPEMLTDHEREAAGCPASGGMNFSGIAHHSIAANQHIFSYSSFRSESNIFLIFFKK